MKRSEKANQLESIYDLPPRDAQKVAMEPQFECTICHATFTERDLETIELFRGTLDDPPEYETPCPDCGAYSDYHQERKVCEVCEDVYPPLGYAVCVDCFHDERDECIARGRRTVGGILVLFFLLYGIFWLVGGIVHAEEVLTEEERTEEWNRIRHEAAVQELLSLARSRRQAHYLNCEDATLLGETMAADSCPDRRYYLVYRYRTDDGQTLGRILFSNEWFDKVRCEEMGSLVVKQQYHPHSGFECIPNKEK